MKEIIEQIYMELNEEIENGGTLPLLILPKLEEELRPFVVRELTQEELDFLTVRTHAVMASDKMHMKVALLANFDQLEQLDVDQEENEHIRFKAEMLDNLFYWALSIETGWKYASIFQRQDGDKAVLVGLTGPQAREYYTNKENEELLAKAPASTLVN